MNLSTKLSASERAKELDIVLAAIGDGADTISIAEKCGMSIDAAITYLLNLYWNDFVARCDLPDGDHSKQTYHTVWRLR